MTTWVTACRVEDVEPEDVIRFDHGAATYCIIRDPDGGFHATDGRCTHQGVHLADGFVLGDTIECPKHNGRFHYRSGEACRAPAVKPLRIHPVRVTDGRVEIGLDEA
jgi:3-phenylpropionate/trans-cinnamate dioxygenase ferredoxin subunit